jgi:hypothetical protein
MHMIYERFERPTKKAHGEGVEEIEYDFPFILPFCQAMLLPSGPRNRGAASNHQQLSPASMA